MGASGPLKLKRGPFWIVPTDKRKTGPPETVAQEGGGGGGRGAWPPMKKLGWPEYVLPPPPQY